MIIHLSDEWSRKDLILILEGSWCSLIRSAHLLLLLLLLLLLVPGPKTTNCSIFNPFQPTIDNFTARGICRRMRGQSESRPSNHLFECTSNAKTDFIHGIHFSNADVT
jgi:hypothetical protein